MCVPIPAIAADGVASPIPHGQAAASTVAALSHAVTKQSSNVTIRRLHIVAENAATARQTTP